MFSLCLSPSREGQNNIPSATSAKAFRHKKHHRQNKVIFTHSLPASKVDQKHETSNGCLKKRRRRCYKSDAITSEEATASTDCIPVTPVADECAAELVVTGGGIDSSREQDNALSWSDEIYADSTFDYAL